MLPAENFTRVLRVKLLNSGMYNIPLHYTFHVADLHIKDNLIRHDSQILECHGALKLADVQLNYRMYL